MDLASRQGEAERADNWSGVRSGRHSAVLGEGSVATPADWFGRVVRVRCAPGGAPYDLVLEALDRMERLMGGRLIDRARDHVRLELRRRLLGDAPDTIARDAFVSACNRLARAERGRAVLVIEGAETADEQSLGLIERAMLPASGVELPIVVSFGERAPRGAAARVVSAVRAGGGLVVSPAPERDASLGAMPAGEAEIERPFEDELAETRGGEPRERAGSARAGAQADRGPLPRHVLRTLQAGAALGDEFSAGDVARMLGADPLDVLEALQQAVDQGFAIRDLGGLRFALPRSAAAALRSSMLPSYADALRARSRGAPVAMPAPNGKPPSAGADERLFAPARPEPGTAAGAEPARPVWTEHAPAWPGPVTPAHLDDAEPAGPGTLAETHGPSGRGPLAEAHERDQTLEPLEAETTARVKRQLAYARRAEGVGAFGDALAAAREALASVESREATPALRRLRAEVLWEMGRLQWMGASPRGDFTLSGALEAAEAALAALRDDDPAALHAKVSVLLANVCYDLGDLPSLERALDALADASRTLVEAGDAYGAARLLNDQAAVFVRMGDAVRAAHLLEQSRQVFAERADTDPIALLETAETDHLLARIPLHVAAKPGRENDAIAASLARAQAAEGAFRRLRATRELARVWETIGRLELRAGRVERALERLYAAAGAQQAAGDAVGLARTAAAMADALEATGRRREALEMLADSVRLNVAKGSPLGLAFNRRSLSALSDLAGAPGERGDLDELSRAVARELEGAEAVLGRIRLPGEPD